MSEEFEKDVIDGKIIDWNKMSIEDLKKLKIEFTKKEKSILDKINLELEKTN